MRKSKTPSFILELPLKAQPFQIDILNTRLEIARKIYNACIEELGRRYLLVLQSKDYQKIMKRIRAAHSDEEKKSLLRELNQLYLKFGLREYDLHKFVAPMYKHFSCHIDSFTCQKIASEAWNAMRSVLFGKGKQLHYKKYGQMNSIEGKSNSSGIRYKEEALHWNGLNIPVVIKKQDEYAWEALANEIIELGCEVKVETMRYSALAKRAKETKINEKTGRYHSKKRFGKSIANRAPSMFLSILDRKLRYFSKKLLKINTQKVKASQYNHIEHSYTKKTLSERWNEIRYKGKIIRIQRDLYSAFLIQHVNPATLDEINDDECERFFGEFVVLHNREIERLKQQPDRKLASMGV